MSLLSAQATNLVLVHAASSSTPKIRIITGKGMHSGKGHSVLGPAVVRTVSEGGDAYDVVLMATGCTLIPSDSRQLGYIDVAFRRR